MPASALLYVLSEPKPSLALAEFHDWYDNEHGPLRMQLPFIHNGFRYIAADFLKPTWLATYDLASVSNMQDPSYTRLRETRSKREAQLVENELDILDRRVYEQLLSSRSPQPDQSSPAPILISITLKITPDDRDEVVRWYKDVCLSWTFISSVLIADPIIRSTSPCCRKY